MSGRVATVALHARVRARDHLAAIEWPALGTTARVVVTEPRVLEPVLRQVVATVEAVDAAASRFRPDAEVRRLQRAEGAWVRVSPTLRELVGAALEAARHTLGLVDPTVGAALAALGYDQDFTRLARHDPAPLRGAPVPGWRTVELDGDRVRVPAGLLLDLGSIGKAWCADRAARMAERVGGAGVLVSLGGDIATAGPVPDGGWIVRVVEDREDDDRAAPLLCVRWGGVATSSTLRRRWWRGDRTVHHIVDPCTGLPAAGPWRTATVAAGSCTIANTMATAAIVAGAAATGLLAAARLPARLVATDGTVLTCGGWPGRPLAAPL